MFIKKTKLIVKKLKKKTNFCSRRVVDVRVGKLSECNTDYYLVGIQSVNRKGVLLPNAAELTVNISDKI